MAIPELKNATIVLKTPLSPEISTSIVMLEGGLVSPKARD
jgi:hypothetical protein